MSIDRSARVLHIYKSYYPDTRGGVEEFIYQLAESELSKDWPADVLSFYPRGPWLQKVGSHNSYRIQPTINLSSTPISLPALFKLRSFVKNYDLLHYHFPYPWADFLHLMLRIKMKYIVTYHTDIVKQKVLKHAYQPLGKLFLNGASALITTSPDYYKSSEFLQSLQLEPKVIPLALKDQAEVSYEKPAHSDYYLFIGVPRYYKGLQYLIAALQDTEIKLVVIGQGGIDSELKEQAKGNANISFVGAVSDLEKYKYLKHSKGLILPSHLRTEAFGLALLEGAMFSLPLISCELGTGTSFVNKNLETGLVVPPADPAALKAAILHLEANPDLAKIFGASARLRYLKNFTPQGMVDSYRTIYQEALSDK